MRADEETLDLGLLAGVRIPGISLMGILARDPDYSGMFYPLLCEKLLNNISSTPILFWKALKGLRLSELEKIKPFPILPYDREKAQVTLTRCWVHIVT